MHRSRKGCTCDDVAATNWPKVHDLIRLILVAILVVGAGTAHADRLRTTPGQPLCRDEDSLATLLISGVMASKGVDRSQLPPVACEAIPNGALVEVIERFASGSSIGRVVKVRVTAPGLSGPIVGYTLELSQ